ncbi:MAG: four helix bundle protein [Bacteroidales bacterium]|nr:four helix bundle protein [Bacteroidales bacterium]
MKSSNYKELKVWQKAMDLTVEVYKLVKLLPKEETYALSDQMRRAVVSIPSNIAEGQGRNSDKEFIQFLSIARGSLWELETQIEICLRIGYIDQSLATNIYNLIEEISKMLNALSNSLKPQNQCLKPNN